jgi:hypothetical protein
VIWVSIMIDPANAFRISSHSLAVARGADIAVVGFRPKDFAE